MCIEAFSNPGDGIVLFTPVYHSFFRILKANERKILTDVLCALAFFSLLIVIFLWAGGNRIHGSWPSDSWISRESEVEMRRRLESERDEASLQDIGTKWARMEMEHLESKHSEE